MYGAGDIQDDVWRLKELWAICVRRVPGDLREKFSEFRNWLCAGGGSSRMEGTESGARATFESTSSACISSIIVLSLCFLGDLEFI